MADLNKHRFAQLTYASFDSGAGRGGWQVKQVVGDLTDADRETLTNQISTAFDLEPALPDFPTQEQVLARPARLAHGHLPDGSSVLWHTVDAGRDGSGRPGNVFAHVVVDRELDRHRDVLPISRWRSPGWLRPYGAAAVAAAELVDLAPPPANPAVDTRSAIAFVCESMQRQQLFRALIDAVADRLDGGPAIILRTADHEDAVAWISSITHLLPPSAGGRLSWTTHDRAALAATEIAAGTDLVCVPASDGADTEVPGALVISTSEVPNLALPGGSHRFASGWSVAATDLSELAEGVLADPDIAGEVLTRQASIEAEFAGATVPPVWTTAAAVLDHPDLNEFHAVAKRVVARHYPASVGQVRWAAEMVEAAQLQHPPSADEMLRRIQGGEPSAALMTKYCETVLADGSWLTVPIGNLPVAPVADLDAIDEAVNSALREVHRIASTDPVAGMPQLLHLAEFLRRTGAPGPAKDAVDAHLQEIAKMTQVRPDAAWLQGAWPSAIPFSEIDQSVLGAYYRPAMHRGADPALRQLSARIWRTMFAVSEAQATTVFLPPNPEPADLAVYPYAVLALLRDQSLQVRADPQRRVELAVSAIDACVDSKLVSDADSRALCGDLLAQAPGASIHLGEWLTSHPGRISGAELSEVVLSGAVNPDLLRTVRSAGSDDPDQRALAELAQLRLWMLDPSSIPTRRDYLETVRRGMTSPGLLQRPCAIDLLTALDAGVLLAQSRNAPWLPGRQPLVDELVRAVTGREAETVVWLRQLIAHGLVARTWAAGMSLVGHLRSAHDRRPPDRATGIADQLVDPSTVSAMTVGDLRDAAWPIVARRSAADAEAFFTTYPKAATAWLREHDPAGRSVWRGNS